MLFFVSLSIGSAFAMFFANGLLCAFSVSCFFWFSSCFVVIFGAFGGVVVKLTVGDFLSAKVAAVVVVAAIGAIEFRIDFPVFAVVVVDVDVAVAVAVVLLEAVERVARLFIV